MHLTSSLYFNEIMIDFIFINIDIIYHIKGLLMNIF